MKCPERRFCNQVKLLTAGYAACSVKKGAKDSCLYDISFSLGTSGYRPIFLMTGKISDCFVSGGDRFCSCHFNGCKII